MIKLWEKEDVSTSKMVEKFTIGMDTKWDLALAESDVIGSLAHSAMLEKIGLLSAAERTIIYAELNRILTDIRNGDFVFDSGVEDIHSQIELMLIRSIGEVGKKIHSGRSRNDQVLLSIKLYLKSELKQISALLDSLATQFLSLSEIHKEKLLPGYTHFQLAMPSSFGLWFGAYAESLVDDMELVVAAYNVVNKNPLGSAAGYGSSFPLDREFTSGYLGFDSMNYNVVYAQMTRGKSEKITAMALSSIAATLSKFSSDVCLYMNQNFGFISFPDELTTGSSIMPHKKNPDVFELIRAKCNRLQALPNELTLLCANLPSGYHRDMQLTKEILFPAIADLKSCLEMTGHMLKQICVKEDILKHEKYELLYTVEAVNDLVLQGVPFREAYGRIAVQVENNTFEYSGKLKHTHAGSIGNLCNADIAESLKNIINKIK